MKEFLTYANTEAGRLLLKRLGAKPERPIVDIGKDYFTEHLEGNLYRSTFFPRKPVWDLFAPIITHVDIARDYKPYDRHEAFLHYSGLDTKPKFPQIYLLEDTSNPDADPESTTVDGWTHRAVSSETWSTIRNGAGNNSSDDGPGTFMSVIASTTTNQYARLRRCVFLFDTSSLTSDASISDAVISFYHDALANSLGSPAINIVSSSPASNTALSSSDYNIANWGSTVFASKTFAQMTEDIYNDYTLDSNGIANISKTGVSKFGQRFNWDVDGSGQAWSSGDNLTYDSNTAEEVNPPKLVVTYTLPSGNAIAFGANF